MGDLLRRLRLVAVPTLFGVAVIVFVLLRVVPGRPDRHDDPARRERGGHRPAAGASTASTCRSSTSSLVWLGDVARGDFGTSISLRQDVCRLILARLPATLELVAAAHGHRGGRRRRDGVAGAYCRGRWPEGWSTA